MELKSTKKRSSYESGTKRQGCGGLGSFLTPASLALKKAEALAEPVAARPGAQNLQQACQSLIKKFDII